jgi:hypothetical protein
MTLISLFNALFLFPWLSRQEETYGVLGVAAGLAAALNAVLNERREPRTLAR